MPWEEPDPQAVVLPAPLERLVLPAIQEPLEQLGLQVLWVLQELLAPLVLPTTLGQLEPQVLWVLQELLAPLVLPAIQELQVLKGYKVQQE